MTRRQISILTLIVFAQFFCTSLWFAGNAILPQLANKMSLSISDLGWMTSSVQFGFILGSIGYSYFLIADRFNPSKVFFVSAIVAAAANFMITMPSLTFMQMLCFRFLTGVFLAGIYPVGMKIASDYFEKGLGKALSFLVGALVLGTALPHLVASSDTSFDWRGILYSTSALAVIGGILIFILVPIGPYRKFGSQPKFADMSRVFTNSAFRSASFGYFGHMWELYAFWAFVPIMLANYFNDWNATTISWYSFVIIGLGGIACFIGGFLSEKFGTRKMAIIFLTLSGICCLVVPFSYGWNDSFFLVFLIFWGLVVIADSPLFSSLVASNADPALKGTAITLVTSIGFAITIISIQLLSYLVGELNSVFIYSLLAIGPVFGLFSLRK